MTKELENQFLQMQQVIGEVQGRAASLENTNELLVRANKQLIDWISMLEKDIYLMQDNMQYEILDNRLENRENWFPDIAPEKMTLSLLSEGKKSISRFGDGEFAAIEGIVRHKFQTEADEKLAERLKEVLMSDAKNLLVAIADNYGNLSHYRPNIQREIRCYMSREVRAVHEKLLKHGKLYHNAYISRPYALFSDQHTDAPRRRFAELKRIWEGRDCIFVEGDKTRMGVGNDLFSNAASIKRVLGPAVNAFQSYQEILAECKKLPANSLFIIALGPTAAVLAYDLCEAGYQALDLGHLDLEYEWFLQGKGGRTAVPGKYNNECIGGENVADIRDEQYENQIIARIV